MLCAYNSAVNRRQTFYYYFTTIFSDKPTEPASVKVTKYTPTSVDLKWTPPSKDGGSKITAYHIYKATTPGDWKEVGKVKSFEDNFSVTKLKEGETYYFAVAAENEAGIGEKQEVDSPVTAEKPKGKHEPKICDHSFGIQ